MKKLLLISTFLAALVFSFGIAFVFSADNASAQTASQVCENDSDCGGGGRKCVKGANGVGACSAASQSGASCADDSGCTGGLKCVGGTCQTSSASSPSSSTVTTLKNPIAANDVGSLLTTVINYVLGFIAVIAAAILVYGGIMYMTSAGNDDQLRSAKTIITSGIIGLILSLAAGVIVRLVISAVGGG